MNDTLTVRIPANVNLDNLHNPYIKNKKRGNDHNAYILGNLEYKSRMKEIPYNSFHYLHSDHLTNLYGGNYYKYIEELINQGWIQEYSNEYSGKINGIEFTCKGSYKPGKESKRYAGAEQNEIFRDYVITDQPLLNKINNARIERTQRIIKHNPTAKALFESFKLITVDVAAARKFLSKEYLLPHIVQMNELLDNRLGKDGTKVFMQKVNYCKKSKKKLLVLLRASNLDVRDIDLIRQTVTNYNKLKTRLSSIDRWDAIQNGDYDMISMYQGSRKSRIYDNFSMTAKNLLPFFKLDGSPLYEVDGNNSQLWMLLKLCNILNRKSFLGHFKGNIGEKSNFYLEYNLHKHIHTTSSHYMLHSFLNKNRKKLDFELENFGNMLYKGTLRGHFIAAYKSSGEIKTDKQIKTYIFEHVLFANPKLNYNKNFIILKEFKKLFPAMMELITMLKLDVLNEKELQPRRKKKDKNFSIRWKCLPILLQKMEYDLMVKDSHTIPTYFLQRYDALIGTKENINVIAQGLNRTANKLATAITFKINKL